MPDVADVQRRIWADLRRRRDLSEHGDVLGRGHVSECPDLSAEQPDFTGVCHLRRNDDLSRFSNLLGSADMLRYDDMLHHLQHDMHRRDV